MKSLSSTISASQARNNFYTVLEEVSKKSKRFVITLRGTAQAVVISPEEVEGWEETMEIMANKKLVKDIARGLEDFKKGKVITQEQLLKKLKISPDDLK